MQHRSHPLVALRLVPIVLLLTCGSSHWLPAAHAAEEVAVQTIYLRNPVGKVHRIIIRGALGGSGTVSFDTNRCQHNLFGDTTICTRDPVKTVRVQLERRGIEDPKGRGRRVYRLQGDVEPKGYRYYLTVPQGLVGNYRLAAMSDKGYIRVFSLEEMMGSRSPVRAAEITSILGRATYTAVQAGREIVIRAKGTHPGRTYSAVLERLSGAAGPPRYKLMRHGTPAPADDPTVPFEVSASFVSESRVTFVHVEDADGRQRVPVQRARNGR